VRTNIELDDELMAQAMKASDAKTKRAVVEEALRLFVQIRSQGEIRKWRGKVAFWDGYPEELRSAKDEIRQW
jgi:Arc/MetJ family transcription regulator